MTPETCVEFIKGSTNDTSVIKTDKRIVAMFNEYDKDIDGKITIEDFLTFYTEKAN
jgi:Ca2+-binding EF-hand superfamily protein